MGCCAGMPSKKYRETLNIQQYIVLKEIHIGSGGYAQIWKCKDHQNHRIYALKQIKLQVATNQCRIEKCNKCTKDKPKLWEKSKIVIMLSKCTPVQELNYPNMNLDSTLFDKLKNQRIQAKEIVAILKQICYGIKQVHKAGYYHLDVKPQNIIICNMGYDYPIYKLADFGSCIESQISIDQLSKKQKNTYMEYFEANSTLIYRAPQMINLDMKHNVIGQKSDVWMLGCLGYLLLFRKHPFQEGSKLGIISCNVSYKGTQSRPDLGKQIVQSQLISIFQKIFVPKTAQRLSLNELIEKLDQIQKMSIQ